MKDPAQALGEIVHTNATILLVDEEADTRGLTREFLLDLGCRVITASDLPNAAHVLRVMEVDLVVARYDDAHAQSAAAALRVCAGATPIIALSAGADTLKVLLDALGRALAQAMEAPSSPSN